MEGTALPGLNLNVRGRWIYDPLPQLMKLVSFSLFHRAGVSLLWMGAEC